MWRGEKGAFLWCESEPKFPVVLPGGTGNSDTPRSPVFFRPGSDQRLCSAPTRPRIEKKEGKGMVFNFLFSITWNHTKKSVIRAFSEDLILSWKTEKDQNTDAGKGVVLLLLLDDVA